MLGVQAAIFSPSLAVVFIIQLKTLEEKKDFDFKEIMPQNVVMLIMQFFFLSLIVILCYTLKKILVLHIMDGIDLKHVELLKCIDRLDLD